MQTFEYGLAKYDERCKEVGAFRECLEEAKDDNRKLGIAKITAFLKYKTGVGVVVLLYIYFIIISSKKGFSIILLFTYLLKSKGPTNGWVYYYNTYTL